MTRWLHLREELTHHLPFTIFFGAAGVLLAGLLTYHATVIDLSQSGAAAATTAAHDHVDQAHELEGGFHSPSAEAASPIIFHVFHPVHMLLSAMATTAMFWRYERRWLKAILIGALGSAGVCGVSDVLMPFLGGKLLGTSMSFHWCLLEHPRLVIPFLCVGILGGLLAEGAVERSTVYSHSGHVFVSSVASIFYLLSFGLHDWVSQVGYVFILVVLAVMLPCCASDIVFPMAVVTGEAQPVHCHGSYHGGHVHFGCEHEHGAEHSPATEDQETEHA